MIGRTFASSKETSTVAARFTPGTEANAPQSSERSEEMGAAGADGSESPAEHLRPEQRGAGAGGPEPPVRARAPAPARCSRCATSGPKGCGPEHPAAGASCGRDAAIRSVKTAPTPVRAAHAREINSMGPCVRLQWAGSARVKKRRLLEDSRCSNTTQGYPESG